MRSLLFNVRPRRPNVGNDLIALATAALVEQVWPEPADIVSLPAQGADGPKGSGLDRRNVYEINQLADALLVGGGNLFENGALDVERQALHALTVPYAVMGVSAGRVYDRTGHLTERTDALPASVVVGVCAQASVVLARDRATAAALESFGIPDVRVSGCPTLFLARTLAEASPAPDLALSGSALISIRHPDLMSVPYADRGRVADDVRRIAQDLRDGGHSSVALLCHDYQDLAFAATFPDLEARYTEDPVRLLSWLRGCETHVGYRLHGFLPRLAFGLPSVHISYDERGESMLETLGVAAASEVRMLGCDDVPGAVRELWEAGESAPRDVIDALWTVNADALAGLADAALQRRAGLPSRAEVS